MNKQLPTADKPMQSARTQRSGKPRAFRALAALTLTAIFVVGGWAVWAALPGPELQGKTAVDLPQDIGFTQQLDASIPGEATFFDSTGRRVTLAEVMSADRPALLNLVYFQCPMLCNMSMDAVLRTLNTMQLRVGRDFDVITISFDPREKPPLAAGVKQTTLKRYQDPESAAGWHFLTGEQESIDQVTEAVGFKYEFDEATGQFAHAAGVVMITPDGRISRYLTGIDYSARDIRLGLVESSAGKIGTPTDQVLLLCYSYDPLSGKYGLAVSRAIKAAGLATLLCIGTGIVFMLRREQVGLGEQETDYGGQADLQIDS